MTKKARLRALNHQTSHLRRRLERLRRTSYRYSWIRIGIFLAGLFAAGMALHFVGAWLCAVCAVAAALPFGVAVYSHRRVDGSILRHQVWLEIKSAQIARGNLDWERIPVAYGHRPRPDHPFEADLDLIGQRSVLRLLDTAVSYEGSQRLRAWLTAPVPDAQGIVQRQQLVRELAPLSLFRDKLILNATMAAGTKRTWEANQLVRWLKRQAPEASLRLWLWVLSGLAVLNAVLFVANRLGLLPPWWQITFVLYLGLLLARSRETGAIWEEAMALEGALRQLGAVFRQLERFSYRNTPRLKALCKPFLDHAHRPSNYVGRINRVLAGLGLRGNPLMWFALNALVPWDLYFGHRLNQCKTDMARDAPAWMEAWFELEASSSLANLAYLNPDYTLPDVAGDESQERPMMFRAQSLGHPLIPDDERVCNGFEIPELGQVTIITGSNMAGKSVFLKTVGVNLALAYAGGPVNAQEMQIVLFRLFTSIGVTESVTDGISYFYGEVKRLKALLAELEREHPLPLLYCIDEIFRGTNNRERLIGSRAFVRALAGMHGVGFIATHDLELVKLADETPQVKNYHFRDRVVEGQMMFDYALRSGPCPTTNALRIMQLEGLPVEWMDEDLTIEH
ncbi:MAG: hypothetical protein JSV36_07460 [Anaerolineae bacterium]|nr:MAG: hypothetical protein JSV36_07460 [Anaerolineae bacterium]